MTDDVQNKIVSKGCTLPVEKRDLVGPPPWPTPVWRLEDGKRVELLVSSGRRDIDGELVCLDDDGYVQYLRYDEWALALPGECEQDASEFQLLDARTQADFDYEKAVQLGLTDSRARRWENGIDHHPESERLMRFLAHHDFRDFGDYFKWRLGGDGDNGETLMYEMDAYFEMRDGVRRSS